MATTNDSAREAYVALCRQYRTTDTTSLRAAIAAAEKIHDELTARLGSRKRFLVTKRTRDSWKTKQKRSGEWLASLRQQLGDLERGNHFGAEFDAFGAHENIAGIEVVGARIELLTTEIGVRYRGQRYWVDPLRIRIEVGGYSTKLTVLPSRPNQKSGNLDDYYNDLRDMPHPHVMSDGIICLGNLAAEFEPARQGNQWPLMIELVLLVLETCSEIDSYGRDHPRLLRTVATRVESI